VEAISEAGVEGERTVRPAVVHVPVHGVGRGLSPAENSESVQRVNASSMFDLTPLIVSREGGRGRASQRAQPLLRQQPTTEFKVDRA